MKERVQPRPKTKHDGGRSMFVTTVTAAFLAAAATCAVARTDLDAFLERTERMSEYPMPARADITILTGDGKTEEAILIVDPASGKQFFAVKSTGYRALSPMDWTGGKAVAKAGAAAVAHGADEPFAELDLRPMEFFGYWAGDYQTAFISDDNRLEKTVTVYAKEEVPYILFVITFGKEKLVPLIAKFYKDQMNNLVRIRKDSDHVMVGSRPRPQKIVITDYTDNDETTLSLAWKSLDSAPVELFRDASFDSANIEWSDVAADAAP
jgi:hypothetical protein